MNSELLGKQSNGVLDIQEKIRMVREMPVMLDRDLAELYGVEVKRLNQQVNRNLERFPEGYMFQLSSQEMAGLKLQNATSSWGGARKPARAFSEQGVAMLSSILHTETAIKTSIMIINTFVAMRKVLMTSMGVLQRIGAIEIRQLESDRRLETIFDVLDRNNLLPNGMFLPGSEFDAMCVVMRKIEAAKKEIVIIDPYADSSTLELLAKKVREVTVKLVCKEGRLSIMEVEKFNKQYGGLEVATSETFHDRFIIIDGEELYNLGSSINHLGQKVTTYSTRDVGEIKKLAKLLEKDFIFRG